jgi:hypothetical protein
MQSSHNQLILIFASENENKMNIENSENEATLPCILCKHDPCICLKELV